MFYGLLGEIVNSVDPYTEAARPAVLVHLLGGCGAMIGRGPHMVAGFAWHPASAWALVVGGTSLGAKGTAAAVARKFLRQADQRFTAARILPALSTGEGLIQLVRDPSDEVGKDGRLLDEGAPDKRLFVLLPEFRTVMAQAKREANTLTATLREAWDSPEVLSVPTKNTPLRASGAHVVMVAHVTPGEFRARMDPAEIAGGLLNRFLIIASRSSKDLPDEMDYPEEDLRAYGKRLSESIDWARQLGARQIHMRMPARKLWRASYAALKNPTGARSEDDEGLVSSVVVRARPHVLRLALTYALLDQEEAVGEQHLAAALALWKFSLDSARWLFRAANPDLVRVRAFIDDAGPEGRSRDQISAGLFGKHISKEDLDRLLDQLGDDYEARAVKTGGRPRTMYRRAGKAEDAGKGRTSDDADDDGYLSPRSAGKGPYSQDESRRSDAYSASDAFPAGSAGDDDRQAAAR